jgi:hypothetical protein
MAPHLLGARPPPLKELTMHRISFVLSLAFLGILAGCSAETGEETAESGTGAVITASCPDTLDLTISGISIFDHVDAPADFKEEVDAVVTELKATHTIQAKGRSVTRKSGHCIYDGTRTAGHVFSLDLYSKDGKDILELDYNPKAQNGDEVRLYAFPTSYSSAGIVLPTGANSTLFTVVGPAGEGLPELVKIGKANVR